MSTNSSACVINANALLYNVLTKKSAIATKLTDFGVTGTFSSGSTFLELKTGIESIPSGGLISIDLAIGYQPTGSFTISATDQSDNTLQYFLV